MKLIISALLATCIALPHFALAKDKPRFQNDVFKNKDKKIYTIWPQIPFYEGGDIGQYEKTMSQTRDEVRKEFWKELTDALKDLADKGAAVEVMIEPMAKILMMFTATSHEIAHDPSKPPLPNGGDWLPPLGNGGSNNGDWLPPLRK